MVYTAVSLFSGCGGFCEGVKLSGFNILAAVELDRFAVETYRHNFPKVPLFADDVSLFLNDEDERWRTVAPEFAHLDRDGEIDLVFGGPPCQGYSQIGTRLLDDPRNQLYGEFVRVLTTLRPRMFIMENVPNMLLMSKGVFKTRVLEAFAEAGYKNCGVRVLSANDFGVPQTRDRAIFMGVRDDLAFEYGIGDWMSAVAPSLYRSGPTVWESIGDLPQQVSPDDTPLAYPSARQRNEFLRDMRLDRKGRLYGKMAQPPGQTGYLLHNHHTKEIQERRAALIKLLKPGLKADSLPKDVWDGRRPEKWRRFHPDKPAHTLLAQMHRDLSEWIHPIYHRWITVREAARLQSFHDGFEFRSSEWQMLKQIGNAVPPLLGRGVAGIAHHALEHIDQGELTLDLRDQDGVAIPLRLAV